MDSVIIMILAPLGVYLFARLATAAYFKSKQNYEESKHG